MLGNETDRALEEAEEAARERGLSFERHRLEGDIAKQVLHFASEIKADVIVMGTHGRTGIARGLLGSVCEAVVRASEIPVLTVRGPLSLSDKTLVAAKSSRKS